MSTDDLRKAYAAELAADKITQTQYDARLAALAHKDGMKNPPRATPAQPLAPRPFHPAPKPTKAPTKAPVKAPPKVTKAVVKKVAVKIAAPAKSNGKLKDGQRHCPHCGKPVDRGARCPDRASKAHREMTWTQ